ncbi:hypothetical protein SAMN05216436_107101 [bacterium A37T11]|nr:hypothetical protein SAMN05216436_107101 [bacterium A37T11]
MAINASELGFAGMLVSPQNAPEAGMVNQLKVYGMANLRQVVEFFNGSLDGVDPVKVDTWDEVLQETELDTPKPRLRSIKGGGAKYFGHLDDDAICRLG